MQTQSEHTKPLTFGKADFDHLYEQPDPRAYFQGLGALDYEVPSHGHRVFAPLLEVIATETPTVVDLCCSYGVNAALLKHDLTLADLYDHYQSPGVMELTTDELVEIDREFYAGARRSDAPRVVGLDSAAPAVEYALAVGLLDEGMVENLEAAEPSDELAAAVARADLVTVTGGIGYVTERTFGRLLDCTDADRRPWFASLCLRTVAFEPIAECLSAQGLVTERLEGVTFPQRRFATPDEQRFALAELDDLGIEPSGREAAGSYHVDVFVSRPADEAAEVPIEEVLGELTGAVTDARR